MFIHVSASISWHFNPKLSENISIAAQQKQKNCWSYHQTSRIFCEYIHVGYGSLVFCSKLFCFVHPVRLSCHWNWYNKTLSLAKQKQERKNTNNNNVAATKKRMRTKIAAIILIVKSKRGQSNTTKNIELKPVSTK